MRIILNAALAAGTLVSITCVVSAGKENHLTDETSENVAQVTDGFSSGTCLNERYQITNPGSTLSCSPTFTRGGGMGKFWTQLALKAPATCVEGHALTVEDLEFESLFDMDARDFAIFVYTGDYSSDVSSSSFSTSHAPIYGERCVIQTLTTSNDDVSNAPMASIEDVDGDSCHDISVDQKAGASIETTIKFAQGFTIPCTDFGGDAEEGIRMAKIQICSSYRTAADDYSCDVNGPSPCGPDSCWCDTIDLGVEIVSEEFADPSCAPTLSPNFEPSIVESTHAVDDSIEACANTAMSMNVIYNDVYPADSPLKLNNIIENGEYGSCAIAGGTGTGVTGPGADIRKEVIIYFPNPGYMGTDSCIYEACAIDQDTGEMDKTKCQQATISINVNDCPVDKPSSNELTMVSPGVADQPTPKPTCDDLKVTATDDKTTTPENVPVTIPVLDNDVPATTGTILVVTSLLLGGLNGKCTLGADGAVLYTPNTSYDGVDTCVYEVCDDLGNCDTATIVITVVPSGEKPVANDDTVTTDKNTPADIFPLDNDDAVEGHPLTLQNIVQGGEHGECVKVSNMTVMYIPDQDYVGQDVCVYNTCDNRNMCDTANIFISVVGEPEPCDEETIDAATLTPTKMPVTSEPTIPPTESPTFIVAEIATLQPTDEPTPSPSPYPTEGPSISPVTAEPSPSPSDTPTTPEPSPSPSKNPTLEPTVSPSEVFMATIEPSPSPTYEPSVSPTTFEPTPSPITPEPSLSPTDMPLSAEPTIPPTVLIIATLEPSPAPTSTATIEMTSQVPTVSTLSPTFGGTPTVGTDSTAAPVRQRENK